MKPRYFIPTVLISIINLSVMIFGFIIALGCMGGPACSKWIEEIWLIFGLLSVFSFGTYISLNWGSLRQNIGKNAVLIIINILICIPLFLAIISVIGSLIPK